MLSTRNSPNGPRTLRARRGLVPQKNREEANYSGGINPGDATHLLTYETVSACRALRSIYSRSAPGGSLAAFSLQCLAISSSRSSRDAVCFELWRCMENSPSTVSPGN